MDLDFGAFSALWGNNPDNDLATPDLIRDKAKEDMIFERLAYAPQELRSERSAPQRAREAPGEPQQERSRVQGREEQNQPQRPQNGPSQEEQSPPTGREEVAPPKKDSRSERDSRDTRASFSASRESGGRSERPSILERLNGYRAQLDSGSRSVPAKDKVKTRPKAR